MSPGMTLAGPRGLLPRTMRCRADGCGLQDESTDGTGLALANAVMNARSISLAQCAQRGARWTSLAIALTSIACGADPAPDGSASASSTAAAGGLDAGGDSSTASNDASSVSTGDTSTGSDTTTDASAGTTSVASSTDTSTGMASETAADGSSGGATDEPYAACPGGDPDCPTDEYCVPLMGSAYCSPVCTMTSECATPSTGSAMPQCILDDLPETLNLCTLPCFTDQDMCPDGMVCSAVIEGVPIGSCGWPD